MEPEDIENRFAFHPASTQESRDQHEGVRAQCRDLAHALNVILLDGREKATAMTKLEEVMFWANASVARRRPIAAEQ